MNRILQSVAWGCFVPERLTPAVFVNSAARIGFKAIDVVPRGAVSFVIDHGLEVSSIDAHQPLTIGLNSRERHKALEDQILASIESAQRLNIPNLICFSGNRNGLDDRAGAEFTADSLRRLAPAAERAGVNLVLELLNSKIDHPDYQGDHTSWGVEVCRAVASPRVKLLYDIYHMQIMEGDIIRTIQSMGQYIGHYHTAGNPGRNDLDENQELCYPAILKAIKASGYAGYVAHEFHPKGDAVTALAKTFDVCAGYL